MSGVVELVGLVKRFGDATAVDNIDLRVEDGEFFSLLGPSGCGKTTTLRLIAGFERPDSGAILIDGVDMATTPPHKRPVNTVFQSYALFPHMTVGENVGFGLKYQNLSKDAARGKIGRALEMVQLTGMENRKPTQLSGGQQQRVALARSLVLNPSVLLLDEPLGALDAKLRKALQIELKALQQEVGITFIYVTHDQEEAMTMSDRIAVMNGGRYEQLGDPESLYERPATRFVAGFLGISNLLSGTIDGSDNGYVRLRLPNDTVIRAPRSGSSAGSLSVGVRPEKIRLHEADVEGPSGHNALDGTIVDASYLGVSTQYQVEARGGARITVYEQNVERATRAELWSPGTRVVMTWAPDHSFLVRDELEPTTASPGESGQEPATEGAT